MTLKPCLARQAPVSRQSSYQRWPSGDPGGAEDGDAVVDVAQGVEAGVDLVADAVEAEVVLALDVSGDAEQMLVVRLPPAPVYPRQSAPGGTRTRDARLKRPPL